MLYCSFWVFFIFFPFRYFLLHKAESCAEAEDTVQVCVFFVFCFFVFFFSFRFTFQVLACSKACNIFECDAPKLARVASLEEIYTTVEQEIKVRVVGTLRESVVLLVC